MLYLNEAAVTNPHYRAKCAQRARVSQGLNGEFNIFIKSMTAGNVTFTGFPCTAEDLRTYCILDTGGSSTLLPQVVFDAIGDGPLEIELEGPSPGAPTAKIAFDVTALKRMQPVPLEGVPIPIEESFTSLGLPTWAVYYTVFSSDETVEFVPHAYPDTGHGMDCPDDNSDDCVSEYQNHKNNGDLNKFCERCLTEGGSQPLRSRCNLCCDVCEPC